MNGNKTVGIMVGMLIAVGFFVVGCQTTPVPPVPTGAAPSASTPTAVASGTIKIGILTSLTGPSVRQGTVIERFIRMGIDDVNAKGGVKVGGKTYQMEAVTVDDKSTSEGGREGANRLVLAEKVRIITGPIAPATAGAQGLTESSKVLVMSITASGKSLGPTFPLTVISLSYFNMRVNAIYEWAQKAYPNSKRVAVIVPDDIAGHTVADAVAVKTKELGMTLITPEFFPTDLKDYTPLVTRVLREKPDVIDSGSAGSGAMLFALMKALRDQGFQGPVIALSGDVTTMREGGVVMNGYTAAVLADPKATVVSAGEKAVMERYVAKYGEAELDPFMLPAYNNPLILAQAMEKAGTVDDAELLAKTLREGEWDSVWSGVYGKIRYIGSKTLGLAAVPEQPIYLSKVENGKVVTFDTIKATLP